MKKDLAIAAMQPKIDELESRNVAIEKGIANAQRVKRELEDEKKINDKILSEYREIITVLDTEDENRDVTEHFFKSETAGVWGHGLCMAMVMRGGGGDQCGLPEIHRLHINVA